MALFYVAGYVLPVVQHPDVRERRQESGELFVVRYAVSVDLDDLGQEMFVGDWVEETRWRERHGEVGFGSWN